MHQYFFSFSLFFFLLLLLQIFTCFSKKLRSISKRNVLLQSCFSLANDVSIVICKGRERKERERERKHAAIDEEFQIALNYDRSYNPTSCRIISCQISYINVTWLYRVVHATTELLEWLRILILGRMNQDSNYFFNTVESIRLIGFIFVFLFFFLKLQVILEKLILIFIQREMCVITYVKNTAKINS